MSASPVISLNTVSVLLLLSTPRHAKAWGSSSNSYAIFGNSLSRDWLDEAKGISISVHGCLWSFMTDKDNDDAGCLEESSEDGTQAWYMMSNCRRAQVVWSVYASDDASPSCNSNNFKESFVTKSSALDFVDYISDAGLKEFYDYDDYPMCGGDRRFLEDYNGGQVGLSCSDASFVLEQFDDDYCLTRTGQISNYLDYFNQDMASLSCLTIYSSNYGDDDNGNDDEGSLIQYLMSISDSCSSHDTILCDDSDAAKERHSKVASHHHHKAVSGNSWFIKLKYVTGGLLLLASFVMFTGILFTNRRRRRALMQRKYRQAKRNGRNSDNRSRRSSRSASKHRDSASRKSSSRSRRSKSRDNRGSPKRTSAKEGRSEQNQEQSEGVLT